MITYAKFLIKRLYEQKINRYLTLGMMFVMIFILFMDVQTYSHSFETNLKNQIVSTHEQIHKTQVKLKNISKDDEQYSYYIEDLKLQNSLNKQYQKTLDLYNQDNLTLAYNTYLEILEFQKESILNTINKDNNLSSISAQTDKEIIHINYLKEHNLVHEPLEHKIYGLSFTTSFSSFILPILLLVYCIFILTQLFSMDKYKDLEIHSLLPIGKHKVLHTKITIGILISLISFILFTFISFISATILTGNNGLKYPILIQNMSGEWIAQPNIELFIDWFTLGALYFINLPFIVYILSIFIKKDSLLLIISFTFILGFAYLPNLFPFLQGLAHYLPTTYLNYVDIANHSLGIHYQNINLSVFTGYIILTGSILIQTIFYSFILRLSFKR